MVNWIALTLERWFNLPPDRTRIYLNRAIAVGAAMAFVIIATVIVALSFDPNDYKDYAQTWVEDRTGRYRRAGQHEQD